MTMTRTDKIVALALALCAAVAATAALAGPAGATTYSNGYQLSKFKVEVEGVQTTILKHTHEPADPCDISDFSSGRERVVFKSKPIVIMASHFKGQDNPDFFAGRRLGIPTKATIERSYTPAIGMPPASAGCEDNGGGVENITQPDCGRKTVNPYLVKLEYTKGDTREDKLLLTTGGTVPDPYKFCPNAGNGGFPYLVVLDSKGGFIGADLSQDELFDPKFQKWISLADGVDKEVGNDYWTQTKIQWSVSFTRLKG